MGDLGVSLVSAKVNAALNRFNTVSTITTAEVDEAIQEIITEMAWEQTMGRLQERAVGLFSRQINESGKLTANIPKRIASQFAFDMADDRAIAWAEAQAGALIKEISDETRDAVKKIVLDSLRGGYTGDEAGEMISRIIGLNTRQVQAVENLYQRTFQNLIEDGTTVSRARARARKMASDYRDRLLAQRGQLIARTEIMRAANNGRMLSWAQAFDDGLIDASMLKEWRTYPGFGARGPCPICLDLRGSTVEVFKEFPNGSMMPPAHPYCRCTAILVPPSRGLPTTAPVGGGYIGPVDPIGAVLSTEIDSSVEKANPYHDPKSGRFTHSPSGTEVEGKPNNNLMQFVDGKFHFIPTSGPQPTVTIEKASGTGHDAAEDWVSAFANAPGKDTSKAVANDVEVSKGTQMGWYDAASDERAASAKMMGFEVEPPFALAAISRRSEATEFHSAIHASTASQPSLFRGMKTPLVADLNGSQETPKIGDSMVLPLTSFSRSRGVAFTFSANSEGQARHQSTIIRVRKGSRGYSITDVNAPKEQEVVSAGRFRVTGSAVIRVSHSSFETPREITIVDIEQTDVFNPKSEQLEPVTIAKSKFRDFGVALAHLFDGRHIADISDEVEKANPYHDRRTGRFTFAPANDMGGGAAVTTPASERAAFAADIFAARERLGMIDYGPYIDQPGSIQEGQMLQKQLEFGGRVRDEIDARYQKTIASPEFLAEDRRLELEERAAAEKIQALRSKKESMVAASAAVRERRLKAEQDFDEIRAQSADYQRIKARRDELKASKSTAWEDYRAERTRVMEEWQAANPHQDGDSFFSWVERSTVHAESQPSVTQLRDRHTVLQDSHDKFTRYLDEADYYGSTRKDLYGETGPGSRKKITFSDDNPLKRDPVLVEATIARDLARKAEETDVSFGELHNAAWKDYYAAQRNRSALKDTVRRRVVKEVLEDAGVEFSDGRVLLQSEAKDVDWSRTGSLVTASIKRSKAVRSVEEVAPYIPKRWVKDINDTSLNKRNRGVKIEFDKNRRGEFGDFEIRTDGANCSLHELMHAVEASSPRVSEFEKVFYRYRTKGEPTVRLKDVAGKGYKASEVTRPDKFYHPYVGKTYGGRYHEILTMAYADTMFARGSANFASLDPELQAWLWSTIILA